MLYCHIRVLILLVVRGQKGSSDRISIVATTRTSLVDDAVLTESIDIRFVVSEFGQYLLVVGAQFGGLAVHATRGLRVLDRDAGRLLHVTSGHGLHGRATHAPYAASKFGLEGFHESLALELEETGVDSIAFRPPQGGVYSERYGALGRTPESFGHETPRIIAETAVRLAAGEGENGGRYVATDDGEGYTEYTRC